jgi:hypothetical protein
MPMRSAQITIQMSDGISMITQATASKGANHV